MAVTSDRQGSQEGESVEESVGSEMEPGLGRGLEPVGSRAMVCVEPVGNRAMVGM